LQALFGKRPTEKDPAEGTSLAVDFTRREAVRKRPEFTRGERGTSPGGPPYSKGPLDLAIPPRRLQFWGVFGAPGECVGEIPARRGCPRESSRAARSQVGGHL
jgi:hypothetical protein